MRERRWLLLVLYGLLLASAVSGALKATRPKFKIATTSTTTSTTEEPDVAENEDSEVEGTTASSDVNATTARVLTGIPQIDYIWDPNLPRELNGFNLSEYPFYSSIPVEEINFKCDGLHDGFYASVPHKCQVYHHCLYGTRYDFLCANFTAFDQRTFICHFASEVDCANSKKYWHRNDALYKSAETTTVSTTTTSTSTTPSTTTQGSSPGARPGGRRRRPYRRRPAYDYYEEYYDDDAYERTRPRGYDRRDEYDYEDRKYTRRDRDRDRNFRDRDYRDRELPRSREPDRPLRDPERPIKEEPPLSPRERFPSRNNRRDPVRPSPAILPRDPIIEDEPRNRNRDQDPPIRAREPEDLSIDERRPLDSRNRDVDERRYTDKGYADDYEEDPVPSGPAASPGTSDVLVKPAAPPSSVYARPRTPPKIRRPVPITEQEKFSYKATAAPPVAAAEPRRRPVEIPPEDDYYDDELEEVRPRRPATRRRPGFRDFYENPRDRDRDRPFRMRYREEEEEVRPRKHPERSRERYYERGPERGRDRSLDRSKDRGTDRIVESPRERPSGRVQESERSNAGRPGDRDHEVDHPRSSSRSKEPPGDILETTRRPSIYERTSVAPSTTSTTSTEATSKNDDSGKHQTDHRNNYRQGGQNIGGRNSQDEGHRDYHPDKERYDSPRLESPSREEIPEKDANKPRNEAEEYSSIEDDYDEPKYQPAPPPPRTAVRIVKRPFLPSRGGNPSPRGLSPVGSKAPESYRKEEALLSRGPANKASQGHSDDYRDPEQHENVRKSHDSSDVNERRNYDAYKSVQKDESQKTRSEDYEEVLSRPATRRPADHSRREEEKISTLGPAPTERNRDQSQSSKISDKEDDNSRDSGSRNVPGTHGRYSESEENSRSREKSIPTWNNQEYRAEHGEVHRQPESTQSVNNAPSNRPKSRITETSSYYDSSYARESSNDRESQPISQSGNVATNKQTLNEVVTHDRLQDIPESEYDVTLNEALTPSFNNQETNLPSGFVLPIHRQLSREPILQSTENSYKVSRPYTQQTSSSQSQSQQQKQFVPSPQFLPLGGIGSGTVGNERSRSVQFFRTPEAVHVTGPQYRHQRGPWHDYTGY